MSEYKKPLPLITDLSKVFYDGCKDGKLLYQRCGDCSTIVFFPKMQCPNCLGDKFEWQESKGKGKIYTFTVTYEYAPPEFMEDVPYAVAIVKMDEGFTIMSNIVECDFDDLACDMPVEVVFEDLTDEISLPKFRPSP